MQDLWVKQAERAVRYGTSRDGRGVPGIVSGLTDAKSNRAVTCSGVRSLDSGAAMTEDTVFALYSCTKAITSVAALQCVEEGLLDLNAPAKEFVPNIAEIQVLDGFSASGEPMLRPPKHDITVEMLLLHTAGFGYDFFNARLAKLRALRHAPHPKARGVDSLMWPLLFDPGEDWEYGIGTDWGGLVIEAIRGKRLGEVMRERIFAPLDMNDTGFYLSESMATRVASTHNRSTSGTLTARPAGGRTSPPHMDGGGGALYGTVPDYLRFIRMWLNDGAGAKGRVLWPSTVQFAVRSAVAPNSKIGNFPQISRPAAVRPMCDVSWLTMPP